MGYSTSPEGTRCGGPAVIANRDWLAIKEAAETVGLPETLIKPSDDAAGPAEGVIMRTRIRITKSNEMWINGLFMAIILDLLVIH